MNDQKAPVVLFTYRKYEFLNEIFESILEYYPSKLYIIHDSAKDIKELKRVQKVKDIITEKKFPFKCEIIFQDKHMGTYNYFQKGLDYVFKKENELIILEDDTIPSSSFFKFCNLMLKQYKLDELIGCIIGCNLNAIDKQNTYFTSISCTPFWGWATWKEKWESNNQKECNWERIGDKVVSRIAKRHKSFYKNAFNYYTNNNDLVPWDIRWNWSLILNEQKIIIPGVNLITNKGFISQGTFTNYKKSNFNSLILQNFNNKSEYVKSDNEDDIENFNNTVFELYNEIINYQKSTNVNLLKRWLLKFIRF